MPLILSFDIGYASIGWCVLSSEKNTDPTFLGTGAVTFPSDDCLASQRRALRRTRRHIRSTRQRIERMKRWLQHRGVLSRADLDKPGHPAPFLLAAAALQDHKTLNAWELWTVLRWYAHNRGYDGNSRWSRDEQNEEDTQKEQAAIALMEKHGTGTMAETVCSCLELSPAEHNRRISSVLPYKTLNAAYPRRIVEKEVLDLFERHVGKIPGFDAETASGIFNPAERDNHNRRSELLESHYHAAGIEFPRRYHGGLLFGQLVPRFDNRIISRCPITWAKTYDEQITSGKTDTEARKLADKFAKVPAAKCPEFLGYRFAMLLANLKVDGGRPLPPDLRRRLWNLAQTQGRLTHRDLKKEIIAAGFKPYNLDATFTIHPDSEEALTLDPVTEFPQKTQILKPVWELLDEATHKEALACWRKGHPLTLATIGRMAGKPDAVIAAFKTAYAASQKRSRKKESVVSFDDFLELPLAPKKISGRAPYARPVLKQVIAEVLDGYHPRKASHTTDPENGEDKPANGILYDLGIPTSRARQLQDERPIDQLINNHLVRHRLLILERLLDDILAEFCADGDTPDQIIVEVARELKEFSGMTTKQIASELNSRLKDFKAAVSHLQKYAPHLPLNGSIIRKCRIAMDLGWHCPFTGEHYGPDQLPYLEREHIIPYATRNTNALHALVLTWPAVNGMKGRRTAKRFILDNGGNRVNGMERLTLFTPTQYDTFVKKLDTRGHPDDIRRKKARQALLSTVDFEDKELGFTEGQLTQTSHLMKLAMGAIRKNPKLAGAAIHAIPGAVTGEIRKTWDLLGCLGAPSVCGNDAMRWVRDYDRRSKNFLIDQNDSHPLFISSEYVEIKKRNGETEKQIPADAFLCPNDECEAPLTWPPDGISKATCPGCRSVLRRVPKPKNEIRYITHLHHAIDAATLALTAHYFPLIRHGENQSGKLWKAVTNRSKSDDDIRILKQTGLFNIHKDTDGKGREITRAYLRDLPADLKNAFARSLAESRVIQHLPSDRSGTKAELTTWGVTSIEGEGDDTRVKLRQRTSTVQDDKTRKIDPKYREERAGKLLGPQPKNGHGKLKAIKGAMIIGENYGLALDPEPTIIPFHQVQQQLDELRARNSGKPVRVLRNGMLIRLTGQGTRDGIWRINSIKASLHLDMTRPAIYGQPSKGNGVWRQVLVANLLKNGLEILPRRYTGHPVTG